MQAVIDRIATGVDELAWQGGQIVAVKNSAGFGGHNVALTFRGIPARALAWRGPGPRRLSEHGTGRGGKRRDSRSPAEVSYTRPIEVPGVGAFLPPITERLAG